MGRRNYKIVVWAFLVLILIIGILYFNYWTNHRYKEGFDTFREGDAVEVKVHVGQGTDAYETWVPGTVKSANGNENYDVSINDGNRILKNQTELRAPTNMPKRSPPVIQVVAPATEPKSTDASAAATPSPSPSPAPTASNCAPYTPISTVSSVFDSVHNQHTNDELISQSTTLQTEMLKNAKIIQIVNTVQNKIVPLLIIHIDQSILKPILQDPVGAIFKNSEITNKIAKPLTHIALIYRFKLLEYVNNYVVKNDLSMQTLDPNYNSNLRLFVTNINTFISGNTIQGVNDIVQNVFKKVFNEDQTDLNSAVLDTFVSNTPDIQNPRILLKNVCNIMFQMGNEILTVVSQFIKYYVPS